MKFSGTGTRRARAAVTIQRASPSGKKIPKPPSRRPNIKERISMIALARLHHAGRIPSGGVPLPGLTSNEKPSSLRQTVRGLLSSVLGRLLRAAKSGKSYNARRSQIEYDPPLTVTLLDESEW